MEGIDWVLPLRHEQKELVGYRPHGRPFYPFGAGDAERLAAGESRGLGKAGEPADDGEGSRTNSDVPVSPFPTPSPATEGHAIYQAIKHIAQTSYRCRLGL